MRLLQASLAGYTFSRRCCGRCFCSFSGNQSHIRSTGLVICQPGKEESKEKFVLAVNPELHQTGTIITEKLKSICRSSRTCAQTSFSIAFANVNKNHPADIFSHFDPNIPERTPARTSARCFCLAKMSEHVLVQDVHFLRRNTEMTCGVLLAVSS